MGRLATDLQPLHGSVVGSTVSFQILISLLLALLCAFNCSASLEYADSCIRNTTLPGRLPSTVVPSHYQLNISLPDPNAPSATSFEGNVTITVEIMDSTSCIILHSGGISFSEVELAFHQEILKPSSIDFDSSNSWVVLTFASALPLGQATLSIFNYVAQVAQYSPAGLFLSDNSFEPSDSAYPQTDEDRVRSLQDWMRRPKSGDEQIAPGN